MTQKLIADTAMERYYPVPPMTVRTVVRIGILIVSIVLSSIAIFAWYQAHYWPFSTGSSHEAFLGATFGMSQPEVTRALKKHHAQLVTYDEYARDSVVPLITASDFKEYLMSDERDFYMMYMPSIQMFGAVTEAEFEFDASRLRFVIVHFAMYTDPESAVSSIIAALRQHYALAGRDDSKSIPGAYSLTFKSDAVRRSLWVNLSDPKKPIVTLTSGLASEEFDRQKRIQQRERSAFAPEK